jgi:NAD(P)-dependent dehydrogenase (short-subunit alcohol dehydrogenase family)
MSTHEKRIGLVTGATRGIGLEIARQLARAGVYVLLGARDIAAGATRARELRAQGLEVEPTEIDLNRHETATAAAAQIQRAYGRLDILVNNAGIMNAADTFASIVDAQVLRAVLEVNFIGATVVTQRMLPLLRNSASGRIVNISSSVGSFWWNGDRNNPVTDRWLAYSAAKVALNMMTNLLAYELRDTKIKVNAVCPGEVQTDMNGGQGEFTVEEGARGGVKYALLGEDGPSGGFFNFAGPLEW